MQEPRQVVYITQSLSMERSDMCMPNCMGGVQAHLAMCMLNGLVQSCHNRAKVYYEVMSLSQTKGEWNSPFNFIQMLSYV